jgi:hypothetical protein
VEGLHAEYLLFVSVGLEMANHFKAFVTWKEGNLKPSSLMSGVS